MARPATGTIRERRLKNGHVAFHARFSAYGERREVLIGQTPEWTRESAGAELDNILADVRRGIWRPERRLSAPQHLTLDDRDPLLWDVMSDFVEAKTSRLRVENSIKDINWIVSNHLLPFWAEHRLSAAGDPSLLDRYRNKKVREGKLNATSINRSIQRLAEILDWANKRWPDSGLDGRNPARDKDSRMEKLRLNYSWLEVSHIKVLLEAAKELEESSKRYADLGRPAAVASLVFAGPRNTELCHTTWGEIDFARWLINIPDAKTEEGIREVNIVMGLMPYLQDWRERTPLSGGGDPVFPTATGRSRDKDSLLDRIVVPVVERAREKIDERRKQGGNDRPLPAAVTPQTFRRTFCALCFEAGESLTYVMAQLGHLDPRVTTKIYSRVMSRRGPKPPEIKEWMAHPDENEAPEAA